MAEKDEEPTPAEDIVVTKYKMAGDMVNGIYKYMFIDFTEKTNSHLLLNSPNYTVAVNTWSTQLHNHWHHGLNLL